MPGIFGAVGCRPEEQEALRQEFSFPWKGCESKNVAGGILGGHAFGSASALHTLCNGRYFAVDGEASIYRLARTFTQASGPSLFGVSSGNLDLTEACKGNVAVVDVRSGVWYLATEWTGSFPLYFVHTDGKLLFSSRLKPLARVMKASPDPYGIVEFLLKGYTYIGRTHYKNICRLLPGQVLSYEPRRDHLRLCERSRFWIDTGGERPDFWSYRSIWEGLINAVQECFEQSQHNAVMLSGGWDSRLLLCSMIEHLSANRILAYSHGDLRSRELNLVKRICESVGIESRQEPLNDSLYYPEVLQQGFDRVENIVFPHWHRAGQLLEEMGVGCVSAGVYGEVLGGHYGPAMMLTGRRKITAVATSLVGRSPQPIGDSNDGFREVHDILRLRQLKKPWYLAPDFWESITETPEVINADIEAAIGRFKNRGIAKREQLIEAFIAEHRGTQYFNAQLLSCRTTLEITCPSVIKSRLS